MKPAELAAVNAAADDDEEWLRTLERQEAVSKMPRNVLENHLKLLGWYPVPATNEALQCGTHRVYTIALDKGISVGHYEHPCVLLRKEADWQLIPFARLIMLAKKIVSLP